MKFGKMILAAAVAGAAMLLSGASVKADTVYEAGAAFETAYAASTGDAAQAAPFSFGWTNSLRPPDPPAFAMRPVGSA